MSSTATRRLPSLNVFTLPIAALVLIGSCAGCGANGAGTMPTLIPVKGHVTFKGEPLTTGTVRFEPTDYGRAASGKLQSDGSFVLTTLKEGDGVIPGHHRVYVTDLNPKSKPGPVPKRYTTPTTSKLEAEVSAEKTEFAFDLR